MAFAKQLRALGLRGVFERCYALDGSTVPALALLDPPTQRAVLLAALRAREALEGVE